MIQANNQEEQAMRITRDRQLHKTGGYYNPETEAHRVWAELRGGRYAISRAEAYREQIRDLFKNWAFPGGYTVLFTTDNGDCLCADCARKVYLDECTDVSCGSYDEGPTMYCDECNREIESSYGDPEAIADAQEA